MKQNKHFSPLVSCLAGLGLILGAVPSDAYRMIQNTSTGRVTSGSSVTCDDSGGFAHWTTDSISFLLNTSGQGSGKATALQSAMASWNDVLLANHTLTYGGTTTAGFSTDGLNTASWVTGTGCSGSCLALVALVLQSGQVIVEADITFNDAKTWTTNGTTYDTEAVAAHEFGHSLGIHHTELTSTPRPTMYAFYAGIGERSLEPDDELALQCSQDTYPVGPEIVTFHSIASEDGWTRESTETSNLGGAADATGKNARPIRAGDGIDRQYKSILSFDTSSIPAGAQIVSATLRLRRGQVTGANPFDGGFGNLEVAIKTGTFGSASLQSSDFQAAATATAVTAMSSPAADLDWSEGVFTAAGLAAINTTGKTQLRIYFVVDDNDNGVTDYIGFYSSDNSDPESHPQLVIKYEP